MSVSSRHSTGSTAGLLVHLGNDRAADGLDLLQLVLVLFRFGRLVAIEPADGLLALVQDLLAIGLVQLALDVVVLHGGLHVEAVRLEAVLGSDAILLLVILLLVLLGLGHHPLNFLFAEPALVIGDGDLLLLARRLVDGRDVEDAVGVDVKGDLDLGDASRSRRNSGQVEFAEKVVVASHGTLTFVDLKKDKNKITNFRNKLERLSLTSLSSVV